MTQPEYFRSSVEFREWLALHHNKSSELLLGFYKKSSGASGLSYPEALDEALCFGWIDGVRKRVDEVRYTIRFTPRKARSIWSLVNIRHVERLVRLKRMAPSGARAFEQRDGKRSGVYSFENRPRSLSSADEAKFRDQAKAWEFFSAQPPGYKRTAIWWVVSAKKDETKARRLQKLIADSRRCFRLAMLAPGKQR